VLVSLPLAVAELAAVISVMARHVCPMLDGQLQLVHCNNNAFYCLIETCQEIMLRGNINARWIIQQRKIPMKKNPIPTYRVKSNPLRIGGGDAAILWRLAAPD
jgi:hypothetical protein